MWAFFMGGISAKYGCVDNNLLEKAGYEMKVLSVDYLNGILF